MRTKKLSKKSKSKDNKETVPIKGQKSLFRLQATTFFLTYRGIFENGHKIIKNNLANFLLKTNPHDLLIKATKYLICEQTYQSGQPHFHAILVYPKRKQIKNQDHFDYMGTHPNIQAMRNMKAALDYVYKEDPSPITNMDVVHERIVARARSSGSLYELLEQQMLKDPFRFDVDRYCASHNIFKQIYKANYQKAINLIKRAQPAYCRQILYNKPGIKQITHELIVECFNAKELQQFYSHQCYSKIIDHINQIRKYPNYDQSSMAPSKTPHLLIVGDSSIGKSALVDHRTVNSSYPYPGLMHYYSCYHLSIGQKYFPIYRSFDYRMVRWNQFVIDSDLFPKKSYNRLLDYLEGAPSALPQKGRAPVERQDNPKHILTSNRTLYQHIDKTFSNPRSRTLARMNLGTRIDCVVIPKGKNIHFLRKLFIPNS